MIVKKFIDETGAIDQFTEKEKKSLEKSPETSRLIDAGSQQVIIYQGDEPTQTT